MEDDVRHIGPPGRHYSAGADVARLMLRAGIGGTMMAHGVRHGRSLDGTAAWFGSIGFRRPRLQAVLSAVVEIGAGAAVVVGAATPLATSAVVGTMAVAIETVHRPNGFFITSEGYEYTGNLAISAAALAALGPGRFSVDGMLGAPGGRGGVRAAGLAVGLGILGAAAQMAAFLRRPAGS